MKNFDNQIESWLLNELEPPEQAKFEQALNQDDGLKTAVEQQHELMLRLDALRLRKKVSRAIQPPVSTDERAKTISLFSPKLVWSKAAAFALVAAFTLFFWQKGAENQGIVQKNEPIPENTTATKTEKTVEFSAPETSASPENRVEKQAENPKSVPTSRDRNPKAGNPALVALANEFYVKPPDSFFRDAFAIDEPQPQITATQKAVEAFEAKNYRFAAALLQSDSSLSEDDTARFLRAQARFLSGEMAGAEADFERLKTNFQFKHEARWNGLLCRLARGKNIQPELDGLIGEADFPFQKQAAALKKAISN